MTIRFDQSQSYKSIFHENAAACA